MTDLGRKRIPVLWSTVGETAMAKGFCSNKGDIQSVSVWTKTKSKSPTAELTCTCWICISIS